MFPPPGSIICESLSYDFENPDKITKWRGIFVGSLRKVLHQVHPSLEGQEDALDYVERVILRMLSMLCSHPPPNTPQDVEKRVISTFPRPIDMWALKDAKEALEKGKKKLFLPVNEIHQLLQKEVFQHKIEHQLTLFIVGILEYISADILKLAGIYVKNIRHMYISCEDVKVSMCADMVLMDLFCKNDNNSENSQSNSISVVSQTYEELFQDLMYDERQYLRELQMIIKVFKKELSKFTASQNDLEILFSNITEIYEVSLTLFGSLEDVIEITEESQTITVGSCFEDLAEAGEFDAYTIYASDMKKNFKKFPAILSKILSNPEVYTKLHQAGHGFIEAVKYYLPKLLMQPLWHCKLYYDYILKALNKRKKINRNKGVQKKDKDQISLESAQSILCPIYNNLLTILNCFEKFPEREKLMQSRARRQTALDKTRELQKFVDGWDQKDIGQCCNEFIREDILGKVGSNGRRLTERKALLFDGLLVLCKPSVNKRMSVSVGTVTGSNHPTQADSKLKERFFIRKVDIIDREDTDEIKNAFEIAPRDHPSVILVAKSVEEKCSWMADLIMLNTKSMLERTLDNILLEEEKKHPLQLPPKSLYKFSKEDSPEFIILENKENADVPLIKGATLEKLVERLTYHVYTDPAFVRTFLITYRSFCYPKELLDLLIDRFNIPDPSLVYDDERFDCKQIPREDYNRYRKEFCQPVQFRVLNVLRQWVDHHFYDFERDSSLLEKLQNFLDNVNSKPMKKWVDTVRKIFQRKCDPTEQKPITFSFNKSPPAIEWHLKVPEEEWNILTLHPVEFARQLTLLEFELYRNVKSSELVGKAWTRKDKEKKSPNLLKMISHTNNLTRWIQKSIVEADNFEERVAIVSRAIEVMMVLLDLNNFTGVLAINSALVSSSVHRLKFTFQQISGRLEKGLEEAEELNNDHQKKYKEQLRSINPPCVPFFGMYLTNIVHIEDGNPDLLPNSQLINFSKRRKVAEIIGEIQQYQNQPYCLLVEPRIRHFIETLNPFDSDMEVSKIEEYLFKKSELIEPKTCERQNLLPKAPRKWPGLNLKSPGIKNRSFASKLPAPLQAMASSVRLNDPPSASSDTSNPIELPETPPHSVFSPILLGGGLSTPGSPSTSLSMSPGNSPQLMSPGFYLSPQIPSSSLVGSPGAVSLMQTPPSNNNLPPPLPPRTYKRREIDNNVPVLPPREGITPPPLPPRRDSPRIPVVLNSSSSELLARRNSTQNHRHVSYNGFSPNKPSNQSPNGGELTPKLPPKPQVLSVPRSPQVFKFPERTS